MKFIILLFPAEGDINDVLIKTLAEAHANTNIKLEVVHEMFRKPQVGFWRDFPWRKLLINALMMSLLLLFVGHDPAALLQELVQGRFMVGLCRQTDSYDSEHHWVCETHTRIYAIKSRWSGKYCVIRQFVMKLISLNVRFNFRFFC